MTDNVKAGEIACQFLADKINHKGNVVIENGPQVSSVIDRVKGCEQVFAKDPGIKILDEGQDAKGSREGGLAAMQGYLTRFPDLAGRVLRSTTRRRSAPTSRRSSSTARTSSSPSVDGAPDIVTALKSNTLVQASASQDPYAMGQTAVEIGQEHPGRQEAGEPDRSCSRRS